MDRVFQVFVSSTYADLKDERKRVSETLAKAGYFVAGMELFPAADQQQLEFIKRVIDRSDYYVVIVGGRYGSIADDNVSFTEKEYEHAVSRNIPVLAFLHADPDAIEVGKTDKNEAQAERLKAFRERLRVGRIVDFWNEPSELCTKVVIAIGQSVNLRPGIGWVRGDQAVDPRVLQDLERLRVEKDQLENELKELRGDSGPVLFPNFLPSPDEEIEVTYSNGKNFKTTWRDFFIAAADPILSEHQEIFIVDVSAKHLSGIPGSIAEADRAKLRYQFEALGLIRAVPKVHPTSGGRFISWSITDKGRRYLSLHKALKR